MDSKIANLNGISLSLCAYGGDRFEVQFEVLEYENRRPCVRLIEAEDGHLFAVLTTNIPWALVDEDQHEVIVKTWAENEPTVSVVLASGLFRDTGKRIPAGRNEAQVWEVV